MAEATYCVRHPTTGTNLTCGRCGEAVCPRCLVHAPGGLRCPDCAQSKPIPTFDVSTTFIVRGLGAGIGIALVGSIIASYLIRLMIFNELPPRITIVGAAALVAALGYLVGEGISLAVNRKRGKRLKIIAGASMFVAITVITVLTQITTSNIMVLLAGFFSFYIALKKF